MILSSLKLVATGTFAFRVGQLVRRPVGDYTLAIDMLQCWIRMGLLHAAERGVTAVIERAVWQAQTPDERPQVNVRPVEHRIHPHVLGPARVGRRKVPEVFGMWVRPAGAHQDGAEAGVRLFQLGERVLDAAVNVDEVQLIVRGALLNKELCLRK